MKRKTAGQASAPPAGRRQTVVEDNMVRKYHSSGAGELSVKKVVLMAEKNLEAYECDVADLRTWIAEIC